MKSEHERKQEKKAEQPTARPASVQEPEKGTRLSAVEIHDNILAGAAEDMSRPAASLLWSSFTSGLVVGFSLLAAAYLSSHASSEMGKQAMVAVGYPLGFIFVVLGRSELYTENTLEPIIPLLHKRDRKTLLEMLRLWGLLLVGNLVGAFLFAWLLARTPMVEPELHEALRTTAVEGTKGDFGSNFYKAIYGGWLVALMAWLLASTARRGTQILIIWLCTAPIAAFAFRHSIVGAVEAFYRGFAGTAAWGDMMANFLVPALLGNTIGGVVLVALLNYAQVASELPKRAHTEGEE
jgi:formate-nitrite transporter family protein